MCAEAYVPVKTVVAVKDPLLQLISLQKAQGCWEMDAALAEVFQRTEKELVKKTPVQVSDVLSNRDLTLTL